MRFDLVLVGGGLQNALVALTVLEHRPSTSVCLLEAEPFLCGNHTWSFHASDVPAAAQAAVERAVTRRWSRWAVRFPNLQQTFDSSYCMVTSQGMRKAVESVFDRPGREIRLGAKAALVGRNAVVLASGDTVYGDLVVDSRGPGVFAGECGFQKFVGLEIELSSDAPEDVPMLMDASVPQHDGLRFFYVLPISPRRVLVEETFFSDGAALDVDASTSAIREYARGIGLNVASVARTETGVLPLPLQWSYEGERTAPILGGYGGGWFHPTTGYSFPVAVRLACVIAEHFGTEALDRELRRLWRRHRRQARFAVLLNRLLFRATEPAARRNVLERFHRLPAGTVARFYALDLEAADRLRVLWGAPPRGVSLRRSFKEAFVG